jgi:hypothetical protein
MALKARVGGAALIGVMFVGSLSMWLAVPIGWLWVGSQLTDTKVSTAWAPVVVVLAGIIGSIALIGIALRALEDLHCRLHGRRPARRSAAPSWLETSTQTDGFREGRVLDVVLPMSIGLALLVAGAWFLLFAHTPLPH